MANVSEPRLLILETSGRIGQVALAQGATLAAIRRLDEARRHARDLAPAVAELLAAQGWQPRDLHAVIVSRGPGSYTGLRVGIMSAKTLAYTTGCTLLAVETFAAIALQAPEQVLRLDVLADAQQEKVYVQRFTRSSPAAAFVPLAPLSIQPLAEWLDRLESDIWVSGPALHGYESRLSGRARLVDPARWDPRPDSLLRLGLARYQRGEQDDVWTLEPLYLRPSAAEEKWREPGANR
jgi:tRNA threonylcarbamoyladenosine biosynthesis protein TsaB